MEVPKLMAKLPLDSRGFPIPYFVPIVNGKPDFRFQDAAKKQACRKWSKCSICGNKLHDRSFWFICGPMGLLNSIGSDEAMHEDCARFAIQHCPHLQYEKADRRTEPNSPMKSYSQLYAKPDKIFLVKADKIYFIDHLHTRFRSVEVIPYKYENNRLTPA